MSRLLGLIELTGATNQLRIEHVHHGAATIVITPGVYSPQTIFEALELNVRIRDCYAIGFGPTPPPAGYSHGRVGIVGSLSASGSDIAILWSHSDTTLDPQLLGYPPGSSDTGSAPHHYSPHTHRYGWYPQTCAMRDILSRSARSHPVWTSDDRIHHVAWSDPEGRQTIALLYDCVASPYVRIVAADDAVRISGHGLVQGDLCCAWERFWLDMATCQARAWYYCPSHDPTETIYGPFTFPESVQYWTDPLSQAIVRDAAGELWELGIPGLEYVA